MVIRNRMRKTGKSTTRKTRLERAGEVAEIKAESKFQSAVKTVAQEAKNVLGIFAKETVKTLKAGMETEKRQKVADTELLRKEGLLDKKTESIAKKAEKSVDKVYSKALTEIKVIERKK